MKHFDQQGFLKLTENCPADIGVMSVDGATMAVGWVLDGEDGKRFVPAKKIYMAVNLLCGQHRLTEPPAEAMAYLDSLGALIDEHEMKWKKKAP